METMVCRSKSTVQTVIGTFIAGIEGRKDDDTLAINSPLDFPSRLKIAPPSILGNQFAVVQRPPPGLILGNPLPAE